MCIGLALLDYISSNYYSILSLLIKKCVCLDPYCCIDLTMIFIKLKN